MTHSKLKAPVYTNPPMPPSLAKKRPKWGLGMMGRRRSSFEGDGGEDEEEEYPEVMISHRDDMRRGEY